MSNLKNKYQEHIKKNDELKKIVNDFDYILNNMWCTHSFEKGMSRWKIVGKKINNPYYQKIQIEVGHVELSHGREQSLMALKAEITNYIESLL
jgi:hypothetical protein